MGRVALASTERVQHADSAGRCLVSDDGSKFAGTPTKAATIPIAVSVAVKANNAAGYHAMMRKLKSLFLGSATPKKVNTDGQGVSALHMHLLSAASDCLLSESETAAIVYVEAKLMKNELVSFGWPIEIENVFKRLWAEGVSFHQYVEERAEVLRKASDQGILFSRRAPDWLFAMSDDFIKSIERIDKKLQGRVLEAITRIAHGPTTIVGDTMKPLTADLCNGRKRKANYSTFI